MHSKKTKEEIKAEFILIHEDKYNYEKFEYINAKTKSEIICKIHGSFFQSPTDHKSGRGCPKCGLLSRSKKRTYSQEEILEQVQKISLDRGINYKFDKFQYKNIKEKVLIGCHIEKHGYFSITVDNFKQGKGCPICASKKRSQLQKKPLNVLINEISTLSKKTGIKYNLDKINYINAHTDILLGCKIENHGYFKIKPMNIKTQSNLCPTCIKNKRELAKREKAQKEADLKNKRELAKREKAQKEADLKNKKELVKREKAKEKELAKIKNSLSYKKYLFVKTCQSIYGDIYDYSNINYINCSEKINILCKKHKKYFQVLPTKHKQGQFCPECSKEIRSLMGLESNKSNEKKFYILRNMEKYIEKKSKEYIESLPKKNKNLYIYNNVRYINKSIKIKIICKKHGEFWQLPGKHKNGSGCPKCAGKNLIKGIEIKEYFNNAVKTSHNNKAYRFDKLKYINNKTHVEIGCNIKNHGYFLVTPDNFNKGHGCPICGKLKAAYKRKKILDNYMPDFIKLYGNNNDYSVSVYKSSRTPIEVICKEHGSFFVTPDNHRRGNGCPNCASTGFKKDKSAILYYLRVEKNGIICYKIGITNNSVQERFRGDFKMITIIKEYWFEKGEEAYKLEQKILKDYSYAKYEGEPLLNYNGNSELFKYDILGWD